ncbi:MAG: replication initiation protein [Burkholderiales bacterium]
MDQPSLFHPDDADDILLKHVNAVALMPVQGGRRISLLGRRLFNVLLHRSQDEGEQEEYEARLHEVISDADYNSKDTAPLKKILKELMSTTVEWQSPSSGEIETWDACNLLSGAGITKDKRSGAVTIRWRFDSKVRSQLLSPDRYARLSIEAITQLSSHAAMALYEICARYVDNPGHKTARQHWRWWKPVLTGYAGDDTKSEYRFFKRDVLNRAIAEINERTNIEVKGPIEHKERDNKTVSEIQFQVWFKAEKNSRDVRPPLHDVTPQDLPVIGRAISAGVKQEQAEDLLRKHGRAPLTSAVDDLVRRLEMPVAVVGEVRKPASWLKDNLERKAKHARLVASSPMTKQISAEEMKKRKAAWTETWLRSRKADLLRGFDELTDLEKQKFLVDFRAELSGANLPHFLKRFDTSGWNHSMVRETFVKFLGVQLIGPDWFKPSSDDILAIAAAQG